MVLEKKRLTVEEFDQWAALPENHGRLFEYIAGEIVEVPSNPFASYIAMHILRVIANYVEEKEAGYVTGEAGGYIVSGERYTPDVAFISRAKGDLAEHGYNPLPPDLAVEVDFPSTLQSQRELFTKVINYLAVGTVVWVVLPEDKIVKVYEPGRPEKTFGIDGTLDGGDVLSGFTLAVKHIFKP